MNFPKKATLFLLKEGFLVVHASGVNIMLKDNIKSNYIMGLYGYNKEILILTDNFKITDRFFYKNNNKQLKEFIMKNYPIHKKTNFKSNLWVLLIIVY